MPPLQPLLVSRIRCFVCKSCLSKFQAPQGQRSQWLSRGFSNDSKPCNRGRKARSAPRDQGKELPEPVIRYFEATPGGDRREVKDDDEKVAEEDALIESLESTIRNLEKRVGKRTSPLANSNHENGDSENDLGRLGLGSQDRVEKNYSTKNIDVKIAELQAHMEKLKSLSQLENLSEEDRSQIREEVLDFNKDGTISSLSIFGL